MKKYMTRRNLLRLTGGLALSAGSVTLYANRFEPEWFDVTSLSLPLRRLDPVFNGYRIAQISDIHADDTWMNTTRLMDVVTLANQQKPDLIVLTGDYVTDIINEHIESTLSTLRHLKARDGVVAILGNHDHWTDPGAVRRILESHGITMLVDAIHTVRRDNAMLHIVGLDDLLPEGYTPLWTHEPRFKNLMAKLPAEGAAILLVHEPDFADIAAPTGRIDLQLSGHTHGGQIRLPLYGTIVTPRLGRKYRDGLYHVQDMTHYTNRGVGLTSPQVRLNCRPEISLFTLLANS